MKFTDYNLQKYEIPPALREGLEEFVRFSDGEFKRGEIPNSSAWVYTLNEHKYRTEILWNDVGCGMTAFFLKIDDVKAAADTFYQYVNGKNILGRGNHFIDICSPNELTHGHYILILHTDGKLKNVEVPSNLEAALERQTQAEKLREDLGQELAGQIDSEAQILGNWTHNSLEVNDSQVIYRKGLIKVQPHKIHILPAHLGAKVLFYTVNPDDPLPLSSFLHGTGRSGPRGEMKVTSAVAEEIRKLVYIPEGISNDSLRSEHPSCYKDQNHILSVFGRGRQVIPVAESTILAYIGKV